ncbi:hypothetical protein H8S75_25590 [Hungatella sp. L12]|uniref:Uncharacterized protein n=1 Tax=Hungatella hominis TaxID=2763050 RepID=A0ABR7HDS9_9FIRM|nr:hypothetical protein [Hungatella hominis]MBC5711314.1 hypothetical protein [Hungatella hominis]
MSIAKMSMIHNSYRYFTVSVDKYEDRCMKGVIYHAGKTPGIRYDNFLEMIIQMNRIFDSMSCPKQAMELRRFTGIEYPEPVIRECNRYQNGRMATFQIYVKFRYNASWQGDITWLEGEQTESFESLLQMLQMIDRIFTGQSEERGTRVTKICQIAINSCEKGLVTGRVQNAFINHLERFKGTIGLADAMVRLFEAGVGENDSGKSLEGKIISEETWDSYRLGGKEATFLIKILFREHSTWQGVIYWRETGEKQAFRSFLEMIMLIASALESGKEEREFEDRFTTTNNREKARMEG